MNNKPSPLTAGLVATKGAAAPIEDMPTRGDTAPKAQKDGSASGSEPLNFRVSARFRREFKTFAAAHDLKLNELLRLSFEAYRKQSTS